MKISLQSTARWLRRNLHETVWRQMQTNQLLESLCSWKYSFLDLIIHYVIWNEFLLVVKQFCTYYPYEHISRKYHNYVNIIWFQVEGSVVISDFDRNPGHFLCETATKEKVGLLVLGTRGLGTIRRTIMGSVSDYVVHHAHCPVTVFRDWIPSWNTFSDNIHQNSNAHMSSCWTWSMNTFKYLKWWLYNKFKCIPGYIIFYVLPPEGIVCWYILNFFQSNRYKYWNFIS